MLKYIVFAKGTEALLEAFKRAAQGSKDILIVKPRPNECPEDQVEGEDVKFVILDEIFDVCEDCGLEGGHWVAVVNDDLCNMYADCHGNVGTIAPRPNQTPDEFAQYHLH